MEPCTSHDDPQDPDEETPPHVIIAVSLDDLDDMLV
jgi:hypothetical protein